ncbi:MAG: hypothetical protein ACHBN1_06985 [Heteroscytonema crispum UTEX LB 1556]
MYRTSKGRLSRREVLIAPPLGTLKTSDNPRSLSSARRLIRGIKYRQTDVGSLIDLEAHRALSKFERH